MGLSVAVVKSEDQGLGQVVVADVTFDSSYPTGGEELTAAALGMRVGQLDHVQADPVRGFRFAFEQAASGVAGQLIAHRDASRNMALSSPGLAIGSGSKKEVLIANTVTYLADGVFKSKTTAEVAFTATTHDIAADALLIQEAIYLVLLAPDGTPSLVMGDIAGEDEAVAPAVPAGQILIGTVKVQVEAGATPFNATTDDLDAAHLTVTYTNAAFLGDPEGQSEVEDGTDLSLVTVRVFAHGR